MSPCDSACGSHTRAPGGRRRNAIARAYRRTTKSTHLSSLDGECIQVALAGAASATLIDLECPVSPQQVQKINVSVQMCQVGPDNPNSPLCAPWYAAQSGHSPAVHLAVHFVP